MKVDRRALFEALKHVCNLCPPRHSVPALTHVLVEARDGVATLTATDLETRLEVKLPADGEIQACIPAKQLRDIVKPESAKKKGEVIIEPILGRQVLVELDRVRTRLTCFEPGEFPSWPVAIPDYRPVVTWDGEKLRDALDFVLPAVSRDPTRSNLNTVCFDKRMVVTTDGHRLHRCGLEPGLDKQLLVPGAAARVLARLAASDPVEALRTEEGCAFRSEGWTLMFHLVDAQFPDYTRVVPAVRSCTTRLVVEAKTLRRELQRLQRLARDCGIKATVNGHVSLTVRDADGNEATAVIEPVRNNHKGKDLIIGFNPVYMLDALNHAGAEVDLAFSNDLGPVRIELPNDRLAVVMPMRL